MIFDSISYSLINGDKKHFVKLLEWNLNFWELSIWMFIYINLCEKNKCNLLLQNICQTLQKIKLLIQSSTHTFHQQTTNEDPYKFSIHPDPVIK